MLDQGSTTVSGSERQEILSSQIADNRRENRNDRDIELLLKKDPDAFAVADKELSMHELSGNGNRHRR